MYHFRVGEWFLPLITDYLISDINYFGPPSMILEKKTKLEQLQLTEGIYSKKPPLWESLLSLGCFELDALTRDYASSPLP